MLILSDADVRQLLSMRDCMDAMESALRALSRGEAALPLRTVMKVPNSGNFFATMPGFVGSPDSLGAKIITVFPGNDATPFDSHQGAVLLFDTTNGSLQAVMDASSITAIRTAAVSGVATRLLARETAGDLAILGAGVQAVTHLEAMSVARPLRRVRAWNRGAERLRELVDTAKSRFGIDVEACASPRDAVQGADIVCTCTSSREPVLRGVWLSPGAHVNAVGASVPTARELDSTAVQRARLYVDRRESALNEAGDFLVPKAEGVISDSHIIAEVGEVLEGRAPGRGSDAEITLFKSLGLAIEDVASARLIYERARERGAGVEVKLGGLRH